MRDNVGEIDRKRLTTRKTDVMPARARMEPLGIGIFIPRATKKSVTKKSRMLMTFAITSRL